MCSETIEHGESSSTKAFRDTSAEFGEGQESRLGELTQNLCFSLGAIEYVSPRPSKLVSLIRLWLLAAFEPVTHVHSSLTSDFVARGIFCLFWVRQYLLPPIIPLVPNAPIPQGVKQVYLDQVLWCSRPPVHNGKREITGRVPYRSPDVDELVPPLEQLICLPRRHMPSDPCLCCPWSLVDMHLLHRLSG